MNFTRTGLAAVVLVAAMFGGADLSASSDDTLVRAKSLYAAAAYDEALAVLDQLQNAPAEESTSIAEYRVFCLLALNRGDEARKNIDGMLHANPRYLPSPDQTSPRIQGIFRDVRRQSLPKIVVERYTAAKAAFERKEPGAAQQFDDVLALLDDRDLDQTSMLSDLRAVASAFRDLARAVTAFSISSAEAKPASQAAQAVPPQEPARDVIYTAADTDVTPPVVQSQKMPSWRPSALEAVQEFRGALRLLIDESGTVVSATMPATTRAAYDSMLIKAAREWKFLPAQKQGVPVRYLKLVEVQLKPTGR